MAKKKETKKSCDRKKDVFSDVPSELYIPLPFGILKTYINMNNLWKNIMRLKKPWQLSEWRKLALMFTAGTLFGTALWNWIVPWMVNFIN